MVASTRVRTLHDDVPRSDRAKRILYFGPSREQFARLLRELSSVPGCEPADETTLR